jgi:hypothetical protein
VDGSAGRVRRSGRERHEESYNVSETALLLDGERTKKTLQARASEVAILDIRFTDARWFVTFLFFVSLTEDYYLLEQTRG